MISFVPPTPTRTATPGPKLIMQDDFSDDSTGWEVGGDDRYTQGYGDGAYVISLQEIDLYVWGIAGLSNIRDVSIRVTARVVSGNPAFGVVCKHADSGAFYYLGLSADGYYAIARVEGTSDTFLTSSEHLWLKSSVIRANRSAYDLEAVCAADGTLTLGVDGTPVVSVNDSQYLGGDIGLFARSFDEAPAEVQFDDLLAVEAAGP